MIAGMRMVVKRRFVERRNEGVQGMWTVIKGIAERR